jgi:hypothetical protein
MSAQKPADWIGLSETRAYRKRSDFLLAELRPSTAVTFLRQPLHTNRWGMRDQDYEQAKAPGTFRIAVLGPSHVMGSGVADGEPFEAVLERRLNDEAAGTPYARYEVLNFGVPAYSLLQQVAMLDERVFAFDPDVVIVTADVRLVPTLVGHLAQVTARGISVPYAALDSILRRAGVDHRLPWRENSGRLRLTADEIVAWSLRHVGEESRRRGAVPVLLALDNVGTPAPRKLPALRAAADAGFLVLNLFDVYGDPDAYGALRIAEWDGHPNAEGNRLIADRLFDELRRHAPALHLVPAR